MKIAVIALVFSLCSISLAPFAEAETIACESNDTQCLIAAVHQANADPRKTTIRLAGGIYLLTTVDNDTDGPNGLPTIVSPVTIRSVGSAATLERPIGAPDFRILHVGPTGQLTLDGLTLSSGSVAFEDGGALLNAGGIVTVANSSFEHNFALSGGAVSNRHGTLTMVDSAVVHNHGSAGGGGISTSGGQVTLIRTVFDSNGGSTGGVDISDAEMRITESRFTNNFGEFGGGGLSVHGAATLAITQTTIAANHTDHAAGAIRVGIGPNVMVRDSAVVENAIDGNALGGAIWNEGGTVHVTNTTFARNINNGGICVGVAVVNAGTLTVVNSTFAENRATQCLDAAVPVVEGLIGSTTRLQNTIIVHNPDVLVQECRGVITSLGNNLIGDPASCAITLQLSDLIGDGGLGAFTDDGTPGNGHYPLLPLSQAIDDANNAACPKIDQIGQLRKPRCDIGAVEFR